MESSDFIKFNTLDTSEVVSNIGSACTNGTLSMFLGAGISIPFGLPNFDQLVEGLYLLHRNKEVINDLELEFNSEPVGSANRESFSKLNDSSLEALMGNLRQKVYKGAQQDLLNDLKQVLYGDNRFHVQQVLSHKTLFAISSLIIASEKRRCFPVFSLNFDDLLESYMRQTGFMAQSVIKEGTQIRMSDVSVYHVHGFVPRVNGEQPSEDIVISDSDFIELGNDPSNFWYTAATTTFSSSFALYLGLSGNDQTMLNIMKKSYDIRKRGGILSGSISGVFFTQKHLGMKKVHIETLKRKLEEVGVALCFVNDYELHLPEILLASCKRSTQLKEEFYSRVNY